MINCWLYLPARRRVAGNLVLVGRFAIHTNGQQIYGRLGEAIFGPKPVYLTCPASAGQGPSGPLASPLSERVTGLPDSRDHQRASATRTEKYGRTAFPARGVRPPWRIGHTARPYGHAGVTLADHGTMIVSSGIAYLANERVPGSAGQAYAEAIMLE